MEIERKFLVKNDTWKSHIQKSEKIIQFYLTEENQIPSLRLRLKNEIGLITLKYPSSSTEILIREEFEYEIPARDVLKQQKAAKGQIIRKTRHHVLGPDQHMWEVDIFESPNTGLILAELELETANEKFEIPDWIAEDVTADSQYSNIKMAFS